MAMTKKEQELQQQLVGVIEANTKVLGTVYELLLRISGGPVTQAPAAPAAPEAQDAPTPEQPEEQKKDTPKEADDLTVEYCRKALAAVQKKVSREAAKDLLNEFGVKTMPKLKEADYPAFIEKAKSLIVAAKKEAQA